MAEYMAAARPEEEVFFKLCYNILIAFNDVNRINEDDIHEYIDDIVESFKNYSFDQINLNSPTYAYCYFYRYGPQSAALVRQKLLLAIENCQQLREAFEYMGDPDIPGPSLDTFSSATTASPYPIMNVVNIGAGPGMDMVGFLSAVYGSLGAEKINFTLIEPVATFHTFEHLIEAVLRKKKVGLASRLLKAVTLKTLFLEVSLPCYGDTFIKRMKSADIILVCKLLSIIPFPKKKEIVKNIRKYMTDSALLVSIDSPFQDEFMVGFESLYEEPDDNPDMASRVFSHVPDFYTEMYGPISECTKAKIRILKKTNTKRRREKYNEDG